MKESILAIIIGIAVSVSSQILTLILNNYFSTNKQFDSIYYATAQQGKDYLSYKTDERAPYILILQDTIKQLKILNKQTKINAQNRNKKIEKMTELHNLFIDGVSGIEKMDENLKKINTLITNILDN